VVARNQFESGAEPFVPSTDSIATMAKAAQRCRGCDLYKNATQAVFGEGPKDAVLMFVGEVPGDVEDRAGRPFVGPAGKLLDKALAEAGIDRSRVYVTNAVKHFKFEPRGKRRIHSKPNAREIRACRPWLEAELQAVAPAMVVALGSTAAQALFGATFRVSRQRGKPVATTLAPWAMATVHPSSLLRVPEWQDRDAAWRAFVEDLAVAGRQFRKIVARKV
jgi:DNA polymerase